MTEALFKLNRINDGRWLNSRVEPGYSPRVKTTVS
jgi:hypothetical protein